MPEGRGAPFLPREHGFWVMLAAVLLAAVARKPGDAWVWAAALGMLGLTAVMGGLIRRRIRQSGAAQLASAASLSVAGAPVDWLSGVSMAGIAATALAWAAVFVACALVVRATFARARRLEGSARRLAALAVALPTLGAAGFASIGLWAHASATAAAALGCLILAAKGPTVKQLKPVGFALAGVSAAAGVALSFSL